MTDMLSALLAAGALPQTGYDTSSRYYGLPVVEFKTPGGAVIRYVQRRFIPPAAQFPTLVTHQVQQGDRIDLLAARYLGDPLVYWRIADANLAVSPGDPLVLGDAVRIPLAALLPGGLP
jgi:nucleoid-associated protein YgaU